MTPYKVDLHLIKRHFLSIIPVVGLSSHAFMNADILRDGGVMSVELMSDNSSDRPPFELGHFLQNTLRKPSLLARRRDWRFSNPPRRSGYNMFRAGH